MPVERRQIGLRDGLRLGVTIAGAGTPLVLLHGFTGSAETWAPLRARLGAAHTLIAIDQLGHGHSDAPADPSRYALPRLADDLALVLDTMGIERAAMLGYSMGGRAALHFAVRHNGRVSALILESTSPGIEDDGERAGPRAADDALAHAIEEDGMASFVDRWTALALWESQRALASSTRALLRRQRLDNRPGGLANSLRGAGSGVEPALRASLAAVRLPTLVLAGSFDEKYRALGVALVAALPDARLAIVDGAGHAIHLERPAEFTTLVLAFLRSR